MENIIGKLLTLIFEDSSEDRIGDMEDLIAEDIENALNYQQFYSLPFENILKIVKKAKITKVDVLKKLVSKVSEFNSDEAPMIFRVIDTDDASLDEYYDIIESLSCCPIFRRIKGIRERDKTLPRKDFSYVPSDEINELKKREESLKKTISEMTEAMAITKFAPIEEKPKDFERNIFVAAEQGKISSVQYLIEKLSESVDRADQDGNTAIHKAALAGHTSIIKYLVSKGANPALKNRQGLTPLHFAADQNRYGLVMYLVQTCGVNPGPKDRIGWTPIFLAAQNDCIDIVKYLVEQCGQRADQLDNSKRTLISYSEGESRKFLESKK